MLKVSNFKIFNIKIRILHKFRQLFKAKGTKITDVRCTLLALVPKVL